MNFRLSLFTRGEASRERAGDADRVPLKVKSVGRGATRSRRGLLTGLQAPLLELDVPRRLE